MNLNLLRENIDRIDRQILKLLNDRMQQAAMIRKFKEKIEDKEREQKVLNKVTNSPHSLLDSAFIEKLYKIIIEESKHIQEASHTVIGFQGEPGAYSEEAAKKWRGDVVAVPCLEFADVFEGVEKGLFDYGIVPVENSLGGSIGDVNNLLLKNNTKVVSAIEIIISHCFMALPGSDYREIRTVYSHIQALSQCRGFLNRNKLDPVTYYDTAGAAKMISGKQLKGAGAIANKLAANLYNLEIIKENIQDKDDNRTRFFIIAKEDNVSEKGEKCSIVFFTEHKSGTLFSVLKIFADKGINLTRIESIPNGAGEYAFFLDFVFDEDNPEIHRLFEEVKKITTGFKVLGFYHERSV